MRSKVIDTPLSGARLVSVEVPLTPDLQAKLARLAAQEGRASEVLVIEAVERLVGYDEWFFREVEKGLAAAERAEFTDHEEVGEIIQQRYQD